MRTACSHPVNNHSCPRMVEPETLAAASVAFVVNAYSLSGEDISFTSRNPINSILESGSQLNRLADRQFLALLSHEPPRTTFPDADFGPQGPFVNPSRIRHTSPDTTRKHCRACHGVPRHWDSFEPQAGFSGRSCRNTIRPRSKVGSWAQ